MNRGGGFEHTDRNEALTGIIMYSQSLTLLFSNELTHLERLSFVAKIADKYPKYVMYRMKHSLEHTCTLTALMPSIWEDIVRSAQAAQAAGDLKIVSPKEYAI
jgi:hypothetical protein